ncbi:glycosyl hydrolase family 43 [Micromonospora kangleipakensis]|uniref:Glycosyl hydrolase family 43 n=2 Tax=Micromonospora kangleipakensis TaxID=1077942 RepID=A0A4Q8BHD5_9ACTN|nr:glycosyl hydrolase family 43 [Micromonospora kangleipakensis]
MSRFHRPLRTLCAVLAAVVLAAVGYAGQASASDSPYPATISALYDRNEAFLKVDKQWVMGEPFNMHFISTVTTGGEIRAYYIKNKPDGTFATALATSTDGVNWSDHGIVLDTGPSGSWDDRIASFPGVAYVNGTFYLVYEGAGFSPANPGDIGLATSTDGVTFTKVGRILTHNPSGWESANIGTPNLWYENSTWHLYYHRYDGTDVRVGFASGTSLTSLSKSGSNPVLSTGPGGSWDAGTIGKRDIVKEGSYYYMVYEGSTDAPFETAQWSSGLARASSPSGPWTKYRQNPVLAPESGFGNDGPAFLSLGGERWVYYRSIGQFGSVTRRAKVSNETNGGWGLMFETESMPYHQVGRPDGDGWSANTSDGPGFLAYGPYNNNVVPDWNTGVVKLAIDNVTAGNDLVATIDVYDATAGQIIALRQIFRHDFQQASHYEFMIVPFAWEGRAGHTFEIRTFTHGTAYLRQDRQGTD